MIMMIIRIKTMIIRLIMIEEGIKKKKNLKEKLKQKKRKKGINH